MLKAFSIFTGNAHRSLAEAMCRHLETPLGQAQVTRFADGEVYVEILENIRGVNCFVVQPTSTPVNDNLMELLVMIDALKRASAGSITAIIPYFGYARQDRKAKPRTPISARLVADLLTAAGVHRVLAVDLHAGQIQGFFNIPVDNLYAMPVLMDYLKGRFSPETVIVSPDAGGVERARAFSKRLESRLAIIDKRRPSPNVAEVVNIIGDVKGRDAIIVDDMIDTAGTLCAAAQAVIEAADARRSASVMIRSSIRLSFAGAQVDCTTYASTPRTFSLISTHTSPSLKRETLILERGISRWFAISFARAGLPFPPKRQTFLNTARTR